MKATDVFIQIPLPYFQIESLLLYAAGFIMGALLVGVIK